MNKNQEGSMPGVKIKFNVKGADHAANRAGGGDFKQAPKGIYFAELAEANLGFSKNKDGSRDKDRPRIECIYQITAEADGSKPKEQYSRLWDYVSFSDAAEWKLDQFLQAVGINTEEQEEGELDLTQVAGKVTDLKGNVQEGRAATVKLRVRPDTDLQGDYRASVGGVFPVDDEDAEELDSAIDEELEEGVSWEEDDEEETSSDLTAEDIDDMSASDLKDLVKEHGIKPKKGMKVGDVRELVKEELGLLDDDEEPEDEDDLPF